MSTSTRSAAQVHVRRRHSLLGVAGAGALLLLAAYFVVGGVIVTRLMAASRAPLVGDPGSVGLAFEPVELVSRDQTPIAGWYVPYAGSTRGIVMVHGKDSNRTTEFGGQFLDLARTFYDAGYSVLLIDLRGHGASGGRYFTLGDREKWDVSAAVDWLARHGYEQIGLFSISLGGASSAEAAAINPKIDALVLDSAFPDLQALLRREFPRRAGLPAFFLPGAMLMGRVLVGADLNAVQPAAHAAQSGTPLLAIYGTADDLIPDEEFSRFQQAHPQAQTWIVEGAAHARIYHSDPATYRQRVLSFFAQHLE